LANQIFTQFIDQLEKWFKADIIFLRGDEKRFSGCCKPGCSYHFHVLMTSAVHLDPFFVELVETFVERDRFVGTSYKAANWIRVGSTTGRSRQDRSHTLQDPVKDVYVYPLHRRFRKELSA
jgi:hypothetical protein